jgi:TnpA family transposase
MGKRKLLKVQDRQKLFDIPTDEDNLIRHYSLSPADRLEIELRRREHNRLGFAVQLCLMRYPGRVLATDETPPRAMLRYVADQIGTDLDTFALYARREETRRDHVAHLMVYLGARSATAQDRRAALLAAIQAATMSDNGAAIASAIVTSFRERRSLLPLTQSGSVANFTGRMRGL